jgi:DNA-binding XRE family transcriptional regulator
MTHDDAIPGLPAAMRDGTFPALKSGRVLLAQKLIKRRWAAGQTQAELARRANICPETLNRIAKAKVTADTATVAKIARVLARADAT